MFAPSSNGTGRDATYNRLLSNATRRYSAASAGSSDNGPKRTALHKALATGASVSVQLLAGHPLDTGVKRLQSNPTSFTLTEVTAQSAFNRPQATMAYLRTHRLPVALDGKVGFSAVRGLYNGLGIAFFYKGPQTALKFGLLEDVKRVVRDTLYGDLETLDSRQRLMVNAGAGLGLGWVEAATLYPVDVLKTHFQTGGTWDGYKSIVRSEPTLSRSLSKVYPGLPFVLARNGLGTPSLLVANELAKIAVGLEDGEKAGFLTFFFTSACGSVASIVVPYPLDTVRTFLSQPTRPKVSDFLRFPLSQSYNGIIPKLLGTVPKQAAGFAAFQYVISSDSVAGGCDRLLEAVSGMFRR